VWQVYDFSAITVDELFSCVAFPFTLYRVMLKLGFAEYDMEQNKRELQDVEDMFVKDKVRIQEKRDEVQHMKEIQKNFEAIKKLVDDTTMTSLTSPQKTLQDIGDPSVEPKLLDWQDTMDAKGIFRALCKEGFDGKHVTDLDGARRFLCLKEVQHILQRTAWLPFNVSENIGKDQQSMRLVRKFGPESLSKELFQQQLDPDFNDFWLCFTHTQCDVCGLERSEEIVVCSRCSKSYHLGCTGTPPLEAVPDTTWVCQACEKERQEKLEQGHLAYQDLDNDDVSRTSVTATSESVSANTRSCWGLGWGATGGRHCLNAASPNEIDANQALETGGDSQSENNSNTPEPDSNSRREPWRIVSEGDAQRESDPQQERSAADTATPNALPVFGERGQAASSSRDRGW